MWRMSATPATCRNEPEPNVAYPAFTSAKPLAGYLGGLYAWNVTRYPGRPVYEELTPQVTIARAGGEKVAGGLMPFG